MVPITAGFIALMYYMGLIMGFSLIYEGEPKDAAIYSYARRGQDWVATTRKDVVTYVRLIYL